MTSVQSVSSLPSYKSFEGGWRRVSGMVRFQGNFSHTQIQPGDVNQNLPIQIQVQI